MSFGQIIEFIYILFISCPVNGHRCTTFAYPTKTRLIETHQHPAFAMPNADRHLYKATALSPHERPKNIPAQLLYHLG